MRMKIATSIIVGIITIFVAIYTPEVDAEAASCSSVEMVFARGSGQELEAEEFSRFYEQLDSRINHPLTLNFYELGSQKQGNYQYPAVNVSKLSNGNAAGAWFSAGEGNDYGRSVDQGVGELHHYLQKRSADCARSVFVVAGYSQGAQVVGTTLHRLSADVRQRIVHVGLFGDPKLHLPEGEGFYPPACRGEQMSIYRRVIANCNVDNGSLGARKPYLPDDIQARTGLWCFMDDFVCGSSKNPFTTKGHGMYATDGAIDSSVREAAILAQHRLHGEEREAIRTERDQGADTAGVDVVFLIDTSGSMSNRIAHAKTFARTNAQRIIDMRGRVALVAYRDRGDIYTARIESALRSDLVEFQSKLNALSAGGGLCGAPESGLHALMTAFNGLEWKNGATKAAVMLTDNIYHDPDCVDGTTLSQVVQRSLEIDPVNVYPVVPARYAQNYQALAEQTSGQVIVDDGRSTDGLVEAIMRIEQRPTALLKLQEYQAQPGQTITYDASDSYALDGEITSYMWDFDGDGVFEEVGDSSVATHRYTEPFDGVMQVRLTSTNGTIASASALVKVGTVEEIQLPAPQNLTIENETETSATLNWEADDSEVAGWIISLDGVVLGRATPELREVIVGDLDRSRDIDFSITPLSVNDIVGEAATVSLPVKGNEVPSSNTDGSSEISPPVASADVTVALNNTASYSSSAPGSGFSPPSISSPTLDFTLPATLPAPTQSAISSAEEDDIRGGVHDAKRIESDVSAKNDTDNDDSATEQILPGVLLYTGVGLVIVGALVAKYYIKKMK